MTFRLILNKLNGLLRRLSSNRLLKGMGITLLLFISLFTIPTITRNTIIRLSFGDSPISTPDSVKLVLAKTRLESMIKNLDNKLAARIPKANYLIINTSSNEFALYYGLTLIKKDKCSTGSYVLLKNGDQQQWMFKTPKGEFTIKGKTTAPVWKKPDWAFIEEGLPIPTFNHPSRYEYGVLGDYALSLGDGYLIHGTLYQRFLGLPVTHGCIRLNDENLELVFKSLNIGSKVYIY